MSEPLLLLSGLRKRFGERLLFDIEHLAIEQGRAYVLTGPNGAGKTTLLRILVSLEPAQGEIRFRGRLIGDAREREASRRSIVYVHQQPYLFHTSLRHNIEYGLRCRGVPAAERHRRAEEAIAWAGLGSHAATPPAQLSGGEKQRAALARVRALEPDLMLLDEPTSNLDRQGQAQTLALLGQLRDERRTVIVACHDEQIIALPGLIRLHLEAGRLAAVPS